jgi:hypothetical protein
MASDALIDWGFGILGLASPAGGSATNGIGDLSYAAVASLSGDGSANNGIGDLSYATVASLTGAITNSVGDLSYAAVASLSSGDLDPAGAGLGFG